MPAPLRDGAPVPEDDDVETDDAEMTLSISSLRRPGNRWGEASRWALSSSRSTSSRPILVVWTVVLLLY